MGFVRRNADLKIIKIGLIAEKSMYYWVTKKPEIHGFITFISLKAQVSLIISIFEPFPYLYSKSPNMCVSPFARVRFYILHMKL